MTDTTEEKPVENKVDVAAIEERARRFEAQYTDAQKQMERFKGIDPERYHAILEDYENLRKEKASGSPEEIDRLISEKKQEIEGAYKSHLDEARTKAEQLERELKQLRVVDRAKSKAAARFTTDALELIQSPIERDLDFVDGDIVVKDVNSEIRRSPKDPSRHMNLDEYLDELATKFPSIVKSDFRGGAKPQGERRGGGTESGISTEQYINMTPTERRQLDSKTRGELARKVLGMNR